MKWLAILLIFAMTFVAQAQDPTSEETLRDSFIGSRVKTVTSQRSKSTSPKKVTLNKPQSKTVSSTTTEINKSEKGVVNDYEVLGLGYSVIKQNQGQAVKVDPQTIFHQGEKLRLMIESTIDGYLYVIDTEADANASLIYPSTALDGGRNEISAHVPYEIPYPNWFQFEGVKPITERLYVIISPTPLTNIPSGQALMNYCQGKADCQWQPNSTLLNSLKEQSHNSVIAKDKEFGQPLTPVEVASLRKLKMTKDSPKPSVINISQTDSKNLVTIIDLQYQK